METQQLENCVVFLILAEYCQDFVYIYNGNASRYWCAVSLLASSTSQRHKKYFAELAVFPLLRRFPSSQSASAAAQNIKTTYKHKPFHPPTKFKQLLTLWDAENSDNSALQRRRSSSRSLLLKTTKAGFCRFHALAFSDALASFVPEALNVRAASGLSWAWIRVTVLWQWENKGFLVTCVQSQTGVHHANPNPHQVVGVVDRDLSNGGAAWVSQVGGAMVNGQRTQTYRWAEGTSYSFIPVESNFNLNSFIVIMFLSWLV